MKHSATARRLMRLFGSSIVDQAMLSAANFAVGLILIRYAAEAEYGYYVLAFNAMMLATTLQGTFVGTPLVIRLPTLSATERREWTGSLLVDQRRWAIAGAVVALACGIAAWAGDMLDPRAAYVLPAALVLVLCALYREYLRGVQLMLQRPVHVLLADAVYVAALIGLVVFAIRFEHAATAALLLAAAAALAGAAVLRRQLRDDIDFCAAPGRLRQIAAVGAWSAAGAVAYWMFTQGYTFIAAATLDVASVAALAASRLLLMPINLMSAGVQKQIAPVASEWLHQLGPRTTLRRMAAFSAGLAAVTLLYVTVVWIFHDWIFLHAMRKDYDYRETLLLLWSAAFLATVAREPVTQFLVLRQRFRPLLAITLACALVALALSFVGMLHLGTRGAVLGILIGEWTSLALVIACAVREARAARPAVT